MPVPLTNSYRYKFNHEGKIESWVGRYDPVFTYDAVLQSKSEFCSDSSAALLEQLNSNAPMPLIASFVGGMFLSAIACTFIFFLAFAGKGTSGLDTSLLMGQGVEAGVQSQTFPRWASHE